MTKPYDFAVFIGRFQPFHNGHLAVIEKAREIADTVIVLVGSANQGRSTRNPWTFEERSEMILQAVPDGDGEVIRAPLADAAYDDAEWVLNVQAAVRSYTARHVAPRIALVGNDKDNSTYYLRMFPQWDYVGVDTGREVDASTIRFGYFEDAAVMPGIQDWLPPSVYAWLDQWRGTKEFSDLWDDVIFTREYREKWGQGPHVTVDACVIQSGHVLLVERGQWPGKGLLALPGGFLNPDESLLQGALRELREETGLTIPQYVANERIKARETYDDPHRDMRCRIVTHAFLIELPPGRLADVAGADDAAAARWVEIASLKVADLFGDHAFIIRNLLKKGS